MNKAWLLILLLLYACTADTWVHRYESVAREGWRRSDTLVFALPPSPETQCHRVAVGLRFHNRVPYQYLSLVVEQQADSLIIRKDTLTFQLADSAGMPKGEGINLLQYSTPAPPLHLEKGQHARLRLYHIMKREVIPHVLEVGVRVEK